jgi:acetylglutamate kinase
MEKLIKKADVLLESLPYIKTFYKKIIVIKYGGNAMINKTLKDNFALDIVLMKYIGIFPVIVHGGGPQIGKTLRKMGIKSKFVNGLRVTCAESMGIIEKVLAGKVNKEIVSLINKHGGKAAGLSGKESEMIQAKKHKFKSITPETNRPEIIDLGHVGEITSVNHSVISSLLEKNRITVITPVGMSKKGETLNINADFVASHVAAALKAEKLILLTNIAGIKNKTGNLISTLNKKDAQKLIKNKTISDGMQPKVESCIKALSKGVKKTHIIDGRLRHAVLLEIFTKKGVGTEIVK